MTSSPPCPTTGLGRRFSTTTASRSASTGPSRPCSSLLACRLASHAGKSGVSAGRSVASCSSRTSKPVRLTHLFCALGVGRQLPLPLLPRRDVGHPARDRGQRASRLDSHHHHHAHSRDLLRRRLQHLYVPRETLRRRSRSSLSPDAKRVPSLEQPTPNAGLTTSLPPLGLPSPPCSTPRPLLQLRRAPSGSSSRRYFQMPRLGRASLSVSLASFRSMPSAHFTCEPLCKLPSSQTREPLSCLSARRTCLAFAVLQCARSAK
jgi:hypothetical protein